MIIRSNDTISFSDGGFETLKTIPTGNWLVMFNPKAGFTLQKQDDFKQPSKIYGNVKDMAKRYLNTFNGRAKNLGIMLSGLKGTGKSLLAKEVCLQSGMPVIMITEPYSGTHFENFLSNIKQECIIFIDEFEKVYTGNNGQPNQEHLLSILDGIFEGKKIFLLTCNHMHRVVDAMKNRPSRIHYMREYYGMEDEIIGEVIDDMLVNKKHKKELRQVMSIVGEVNMDMLVSVIQEMNMYSETAREVLSHLNVKPSSSSYKAEWEYQSPDGKKETYSGNINVNPMTVGDLYIEGQSKSGNWNEVQIIVSDADVTVSPDKVVMKYDNITYTFTKKSQFRFIF